MVQRAARAPVSGVGRRDGGVGGRRAVPPGACPAARSSRGTGTTAHRGHGAVAGVGPVRAGRQDVVRGAGRVVRGCGGLRLPWRSAAPPGWFSPVEGGWRTARALRRRPAGRRGAAVRRGVLRLGSLSFPGRLRGGLEPVPSGPAHAVRRSWTRWEPVRAAVRRLGSAAAGRQVRATPVSGPAHRAEDHRAEEANADRDRRASREATGPKGGGKHGRAGRTCGARIGRIPHHGP